MKLKEDKKSETVIERHGPYALVDWFGQLAIKNLAENLWLVVNKNSLVFDLWKKIKRSTELPSHEEIEDMEKGINEMEHVDETSDEKKMKYLGDLPVNMRDLAHNQIPAAQHEVDRQFQLAQWKKDRPDWRTDPDLVAAEKILQRLLHKYGKRLDLWAELNAPEESVSITSSKSSIIEGILNSSVFTPGDIFEIQINDKEIVRTFVESVNNDSLVLYADDEMYRILNESFPADDVVDDMFDFVMTQLKMMKMEPTSEEDFREKIEFIITGVIKINKPEYSQQDVQLMADDLVDKMMNLYRNRPKRTLHEKGLMTKFGQRLVDLGGDKGLLANIKPGDYIVDSMDDSGKGKPIQFTITSRDRKHELSISPYNVPRLPDGQINSKAYERIKRYVITQIRSGAYQSLPTDLQARHDRYRDVRYNSIDRRPNPDELGNWINEGKDLENLKMIERIKNMIELHRNLPGHEKQIAELEGMLRQLQGQNNLTEGNLSKAVSQLGKYSLNKADEAYYFIKGTALYAHKYGKGPLDALLWSFKNPKKAIALAVVFFWPDEVWTAGNFAWNLVTSPIDTVSTAVQVAIRGEPGWWDKTTDWIFGPPQFMKEWERITGDNIPGNIFTGSINFFRNFVLPFIGLWALLAGRDRLVEYIKKNDPKKGVQPSQDSSDGNEPGEKSKPYDGLKFLDSEEMEIPQHIIDRHNQRRLKEAEYRGRKVPLGKPMQGDVKKFKVYVKDPKTGNVKKVNFGDKNMRIKKSNPKRRKSFRARHNCDNPGPRTKARYWSCRKW